MIAGNVFVASLTIKSNVQVRFQGPYVFEVGGILKADGTKDAPIVFTNHSVVGKWNGIFFNESSPSSYLSYCQIYGSTNSGIRINNTAPAISNCVIARNSSRDGGGGVTITTAGAAVSLFRCMITNNSCSAYPGGGGLYVAPGTAVLNNCFISGNSAQESYGGGLSVYTGGTIHMTNCVVRNNSATYGGSGLVQHGGASASIINCTFAYNLGAGIWANSAAEIRNTIVYFNNNGAAQIEGNISSPSIAYSDVQGGIQPGTGNISQHPVMDPSTLMLLPGSPCIDTGIPASNFNELCFPPAHGGVRNDMGAYGGPGACQWLSGNAPVIIVQPRPQVTCIGASISFNVTATGDAPLSYQWRFNGVAIAGATSSSYTLANVQTNMAADYSVVVSNALGSETSTPASLTVAPVCVAIDLFAGLDVTHAIPGTRYRIDYVTELGGLNNWINLTNIQAPRSAFRWYDPQSARQERRFYRVIPQ